MNVSTYAIIEARLAPLAKAYTGRKGAELTTMTAKTTKGLGL